MAKTPPESRKPSLEELRTPVPLRKLSDPALTALARYCEVLELPRGSKIVQHEGHQTHLLFVLRGRVRVEAGGGVEPSIEGGDTRSHFPLVPESAGAATCMCLDPSLVLRVHRAALEQIRQRDQAAASADRSARQDEDRLETQIYEDFSKAAEAGTLKLPGMPDIAVNIARHIDTPDADSESIARIVQMDPAVTARLIQVANSLAFGGRVRVQSCEDAVTRLGQGTTRELVTSFVLKGVFRSRHALLKKHMRETWEHSTRVAAICHALAKRTPGFSPARALLMGLVHDIGVIPLLNEAHRYPGLTESETLLERVIQRLRGSVGAKVLRAWDFEPELVDAAADAENWLRDKQPQVEYADILLIAQLHAFVGTPRMAKLPRLNEVPAFAKLALGALSPRMSLVVLDEAQTEIDEVRKMLG